MIDDVIWLTAVSMGGMEGNNMRWSRGEKSTGRQVLDYELRLPSLRFVQPWLYPMDTPVVCPLLIWSLRRAVR
jgi:hypothetical protein